MKEIWQGKELTWATISDIKSALAFKNLHESTPLKGVLVNNVRKYKGSGWKVLFSNPEQSQFIMYKKDFKQTLKSVLKEASHA